jgi:hypothetical protein
MDMEHIKIKAAFTWEDDEKHQSREPASRQRSELMTPQIRVQIATHSMVTSRNASHTHSTKLQTKAMTSTVTSEGRIIHKFMKMAQDSIQCDGNGNQTFGFTEQHRTPGTSLNTKQKRRNNPFT